MVTSVDKQAGKKESLNKSVFYVNVISASNKYSSFDGNISLSLTRHQIFCSPEFQLLQNNNLHVQRVTKADEGVYRCEARVEARGEIDFRDIILVVNGEFGKL